MQFVLDAAQLDAAQCSQSAYARVSISQCRYAIKKNYQRMYGPTLTSDVTLIDNITDEILPIIAWTDAPYHNLEHTIAVILVGHQILEGKHQLESNVSRQDWLEVTTALMCHDVGYIKGACQGDQVRKNCYVTGDAAVQLNPNATDASLTPYHVKRGQMVVEERLASVSIDADRVKTAIEFTRFPVPAEQPYQNTQNYPGLVRAADLIGQLADPAYLAKLPLLLAEMRETGTAQALGYRCPQDMLNSYPEFYRYSVEPYIQQGLRYLKVTLDGQRTINRLYSNIAQSEQDEIPMVGRFQQITMDEFGRLN